MGVWKLDSLYSRFPISICCVTESKYFIHAWLLHFPLAHLGGLFEFVASIAKMNRHMLARTYIEYIFNLKSDSEMKCLDGVYGADIVLALSGSTPGIND